MTSDGPASLLQQAVRHHQAGRLSEATSLYRQVIALAPHNADALHLLGVVHLQQGNAQPAIGLIGQAIALRPAVAIYYNNLGNALRLGGQPQEAEVMFRQAVQLDPAYADARVNLGSALQSRGELETALLHLRRAIQLQPENALAHLNLGNVLHEKGELDAAEQAFARATALQPDSAKAWNNLGLTRQELARPGEAEECFRRAIELDPAWPEAGSNLLLCLHYARGSEAELLLEEHRRWSCRHAEATPSTLPSPHPPASSRHRLRIGYVSADFRAHPVGFFMEPLLEGHDRDQVQVCCYSSTPRADAFTGRLKALADRWQDVTSQSDPQLAQLIRDDRIDILIDLGGHTARNRLLAFAQRPAPVQVTYLGYPDTTGLKQMHYRFTDAICDPPGCTARFHTEKLVHLPGGFLCYHPPAEAPAPSSVPADAAGHITFGSFNNLAKITDDGLRLWAQLLRRVDHSRLFLKARGLASPSASRRILDLLAVEGIPSHRVTLLGQHPSLSAHLAAYSQIDIALDAFPYNGTTTTCEALWMGVPVLTLSGPTHVTRVGRSIVTRVGLPELATETPNELIQRAGELAADLGRLRQIRADLRAQMSRSPLCDAARLVREVEQAYWTMWQQQSARHSDA